MIVITCEICHRSVELDDEHSQNSIREANDAGFYCTKVEIDEEKRTMLPTFACKVHFPPTPVH